MISSSSQIRTNIDRSVSGFEELNVFQLLRTEIVKLQLSEQLRQQTYPIHYS